MATQKQFISATAFCLFVYCDTDLLFELLSHPLALVEIEHYINVKSSS